MAGERAGACRGGVRLACLPAGHRPAFCGRAGGMHHRSQGSCPLCVRGVARGRAGRGRAGGGLVPLTATEGFADLARLKTCPWCPSWACAWARSIMPLSCAGRFQICGSSHHHSIGADDRPAPGLGEARGPVWGAILRWYHKDAHPCAPPPFPGLSVLAYEPAGSQDHAIMPGSHYAGVKVW